MLKRLISLITVFCLALGVGALAGCGSNTDADSTTGTYSETVADYDSSTYYSLKWCDEFDGDSLDTSKWSHPTDSREDGNMVNDDTTVYFKDGAIVMLGNRREDGTYYHCSGVQTANKMTFNFGYLEMRAKIPDGSGVYSSFWTTGGGLEIDILESLVWLTPKEPISTIGRVRQTADILHLTEVFTVPITIRFRATTDSLF